MSTLIGVVVVILGLQEAPRGGKIEWRSDLAPALAEAEKTGRPLMLYFTDDG